MVPHHGHHPCHLRERHGAVPGVREGGEEEGDHGVLRPELPEEPVEVREEGGGGHAGAGEVRGRGHRQRGGRAEVPGLL